MKQGSQQQHYVVTVSNRIGTEQKIHVKASNEEVASSRALKRVGQTGQWTVKEVARS